MDRMVYSSLGCNDRVYLFPEVKLCTDGVLLSGIYQVTHHGSGVYVTCSVAMETEHKTENTTQVS